MYIVDQLTVAQFSLWTNCHSTGWLAQNEEKKVAKKLNEKFSMK